MKDKFLHWFYSFFVCLIGTSFHPKWGIGIALGLGVIKELKDMIQKGNKWSWEDILFDLLGIGCAILVYGGAEQYGYLSTVTALVAQYIPWI